MKMKTVKALENTNFDTSMAIVKFAKSSKKLSMGETGVTKDQCENEFKKLR
ncbi:MAG: hypothetical protein LBI70_03630 [Rickettsiales bacterium]|jgi:hypothetical protein|nr:hypothetical protein [Rickettsiales bacterium]